MDSAAARQVVPERDAAPSTHDPTFYPIEEKVGEDSLQTWILELLRPLVERWYRSLGEPTFVGKDQFIYYKQFHPECVVAPDIYVLPGVKPGRRVKSWKVWEERIVPSFALEVVATKDPDKDYREAVIRYQALGVEELLIFDPDHRRSRDRVRWQRYGKVKRRGFVQLETSNADRIRSTVLGCFMRVVGSGEATRLRLFTGPTGDVLFPTQEEAERAARDAERAAKETERTAKEAALARVAELEALLAKKARKPRR